MKTVMINELSVEMRFLLCTLAVWRLTHLLVLEDGPLDVVFKLRKRLGDSISGKAMDCFYCCSVWIALPFCFLISDNWMAKGISWLALSGAACLLQQFFGKTNDQ